ncbi:MAG TPA: DUF2567 domain-containing protein [Micromonosporaceae bacterium]|nr:DUF2567 domain-containing protein [Micromonosporaceae bacterium]
MSSSASAPDAPPEADQPGPAQPDVAAFRRDGVSWAECLVGLAVAVLVAVLGAPLGLLWRALAPRVELIKTARGIFPVEAEPEGYFADDGWFVVIGAMAGLLLGVAAWVLLRRFRGPVVLVGLVVGSVAGAVLGAWLGHRVGLADYERLLRDAPVGARLRRQPNLRTSEVGLWFGFVPRVGGVLMVQAFVAAATYTVLASFSSWSSLRTPDEGFVPAGQVSSSWTAPPAHPAESEPPVPGTTEPPPGAAASAHRGDG